MEESAAVQHGLILDRRSSILASLPIRPVSARRLWAGLAVDDAGVRPDPPSCWAVAESDPGLALFVLRRHGGSLGWLVEDGLKAEGDWPLDALVTLPWWHEPEPAGSSPAGGPAWPAVLGRHCLATAHAARWLAEQGSGIPPNAAYWAGLLGLLGFWLLAAAAPDPFDALLAQLNPEEPWRVTGRRLIGIDPFSLGRQCARAWGLDEALIDCLWSHDVPPLLTVHRPLTHLVQWAAWLSHQAGFGLGPGPPPHFRGFDPADPEHGLARLCPAGSDPVALVRHRLEPILAADSRDAAGFRPRLVRQAATLARTNQALRRQLAAARSQAGSDAVELERLAEGLQLLAGTEAGRLERRQLDALAEFAAGAGHEINNPLAVISGRAQLLLAQESDPNRQRSLEAILRQTERVHRMIVELMFFARPPAAQRQWTDLAAIVARAIEAVRSEASSRRIQVHSRDALGRPTAILADPGQLASALECLIRNAMEAMPDGGTVEVDLRPCALSRAADQPVRAGVEIEVRDHGPGIPEAIRAKVFDPFFSGRDAGRGLGMGLPKAWRIVHNHGGQISLHNLPDRGVRVTVRLPAGE